MIVWVDAQLSPALAPWLTKEFGVEAFSIRYLGMVRATKDADFVLMQKALGPPPAIMWVRCGNTSNAHLKRVLQPTFPAACLLIDSGESLVEIVDLGQSVAHT